MASSTRRRSFSSHTSFFLLLTLLLGPCLSSAITFDLQYGSRKCVSEDIPPLSDVRGVIHVSGGGGDMALDLFVSDPRGVVYFHKADANSIKYSFKSGAFDSRATQAYRFCVVHQVHPNAATRSDLSRRVSLDVKVESEQSRVEVEALAKRGHLSKVQESFQEVYHEVDSLIQKMDELRMKEQTLSDINEDTSRTVLRVTVLAAIFTIGTGVLNFMNLKSFFKQKKLA